MSLIKAFPIFQEFKELQHAINFKNHPRFGSQNSSNPVTLQLGLPVVITIHFSCIFHLCNFKSWTKFVWIHCTIIILSLAGARVTVRRKVIKRISQQFEIQKLSFLRTSILSSIHTSLDPKHRDTKCLVSHYGNFFRCLLIRHSAAAECLLQIAYTGREIVVAVADIRVKLYRHQSMTTVGIR